MFERFRRQPAAPQPSTDHQTFTNVEGIFNFAGVPGSEQFMDEFQSRLSRAAFLPRDHQQYALQNRARQITDNMREISYVRDELAGLVVDAPADDTFVGGFTVDDPVVGDVLADLNPTLEPAYLDADRWNRLYGAGLIVLGFNDTDILSQPTSGGADDVVWAHAFSRRHLHKVSYDREVGSPTYGKPLVYEFRTGPPGEDGEFGTVEVHRDRVLPFAEQPHVHPVMGGSILDRCWNGLEDACGGSWAGAEAFIQNAGPKWVFSSQRPLTPAQEIRVDDQAAQMQSNVRHLVKILQNMKLDAIQVNLPDPLPRMLQAYTRVANGSRMPFLKLVEQHLTSGEAILAVQGVWNTYLARRRRGFGNRVARSMLTDKLARAGLVSDGRIARRARVVWEAPEVMDRETFSRTSRNESISMASAAGKGAMPKDLADRFVPAPDWVVTGAEEPGDEGPTGERTVQAEEQERASTKNQSR